MASRSSTSAHLSTFSERTGHFFHQAALAAREWYGADGRWRLAGNAPAQTRERYWISFALYAVGEHDLADAIILGGATSVSHMGVQQVSNFDIFSTNIACILLRLHREQMSDPTRLKLETMVREGFKFQPGGNRRPDFQFIGYNDNMPSKATMGLILGGEMLDDPGAVEHGIWNLIQMRNMLGRRGINSEWNSPTYSPLSIHAMSEIAAHARNARARDLASGIEERLWLDVAARFHPEMGVTSGPYSRAYSVDSLAQVSGLASLLWFILGDIVRPSPMEMFNPKPGFVFHHSNDMPFNIAQMCWFAAGSYHPSPRALGLFTHKAYPFHASATAEMGDVFGDFPARPVRLETFLQRDFSVGTSSSQFLNGLQAAPYFVTYKRKSDVPNNLDVGTIFHKFTINDAVPGAIEALTDPQGKPYPLNTGEQSILDSYANVQTLQSGPTTLVLTHPHLSLGGLDDHEKPRALTGLNEMVVFPSHFGGADEVRIGNRVCESWSGEAAHGEWIGCRRGRLLVAFRPLVYTATSEPVRIKLEKINNYEVVRCTFYQGAPRVFTRPELRGMFGGFVAEHAGVEEYASLAAFMQELSHSKVTDYFWTTRRARYRRPAGAKRPALDLECSWSIGSVWPRQALINGRPVSFESPVQIDGLTEADFPFLSDPWIPVPEYFPWDELLADWGGGVGRGYISDRGV